MNKKTIIFLATTLFLTCNFETQAQVTQQDAQRYSAYYSNGIQNLKNMQFSSAITAFRKVLRFSPYDATVQNALANAYFARAQYYHKTTKEIKLALIDYKSACFYAKYWDKNNTNANSVAQSSLREINDLEHRLNQSQSESSRLQTAKNSKVRGELASSGYDFQQLKNGKYSEIAYENLGIIYKNLNNLVLGMEYMAQAISINPKNPKTHFLYGVMLDEANNFEASMEQYNLALQYGGTNPELLEVLENKWTQNIVNNPSDAQGYINLGAIFQKQGKLEPAKAQYQKAYKLNPSDETILYNLASLYVQQKNYDGAIKVYDSILAKNPTKIEVLEYKANALKELMRFDEALVQYEKILEINPNNQNALANKDEIIYNHFSKDKFQNYLAQKANSSQNSYEAQFNYALELHKNKNYLSALKYYQKAQKLNPSKEEVYVNMAQIYIEEKDYKNADHICQLGLMQMPSSNKLNSYLKDIKNYQDSSVYNEATSLFEKKQYDKAIEKYMLIPNKTKEVNMAIASCYWEMKDYANALKFYQEVLNIEPNNLEALNACAYAYYSMSDYENAKVTSQKILTLDKTNQNAKDLLSNITQTQQANMLQEAISLYEQNEFGKSFVIIDKYVTKNPNDEYGLYYRGLNLEAMNKQSDAIKQYKSLIAKKPDFAPAYYSLAVLLDNDEKYSEALENYEKFVSLKGNEKDEMVNFSTSRIKELKTYLDQLNASK